MPDELYHIRELFAKQADKIDQLTRERNHLRELIQVKTLEVRSLVKALDEHLERASHKDQLITKLTNALEKANPTDRYRNLLQQAREEAK
jgi:hypothetical protein